MILLVGNATTQGAVANDLNSNKNFPTVTISVAGAAANQIAFSLDGGTANEPFNGLNQPLPFPDALQEFKVETSSVGAQTGQHAAASVTVATRSGTNALHGNVFEYVRNYQFNGRSAPSLTRDSLKQNQFGGTIGGAIKKNKLFIFGGEQSTIKRSNPGGQTANIMTGDMIAGDFTPSLPRPARSKLLRFPTPQETGWETRSLRPAWTRLQGRLPSCCLPLPLRSTHAVLVIATGANQRQYQIPIKVDYVISQKQSMIVRYMLSNNYTPLFYDPTNPLLTGTTTGPIEQHSIDGARPFLYDQPDAGFEFSHHGEPQL